MKIVTYKVTNSVATSRRNGKESVQGLLISLEKNTEGFCTTMALAAAQPVVRVMSRTNLDGRTRIVGNPTRTASAAKQAAAKRR